MPLTTADIDNLASEVEPPTDLHRLHACRRLTGMGAVLVIAAIVLLAIIVSRGTPPGGG